MNTDRASTTARLIAAATVMCTQSKTYSLSPPAGAALWCERFLATSRTDRLLLRSVRSVLGKVGWRFVESMTVPGIVAHWMRRKRVIDDLVRAAATEGFTQLIVLGAGLDTLAFRLAHEHLFEHIISADHPATLAVVRAATTRNGVRSTDASSDMVPTDQDGAMPERHPLELLSLDLAHDDACTILTDSPGFDATRATIIVIEGVLMYLPVSAVADLLRSLAKVPIPRIRLVASWMNATPGQPVGFVGQSRHVAAWLRRWGEPMLWGTTAEALPSFLAELDWVNARIIDLADARSVKDEGLRALQSEQLVLADKA